MHRPITIEDIGDEMKTYQTDIPPNLFFDSTDQSPYLPRKEMSDVDRQYLFHKRFFRRILRNVRYIAEYFKRLEDDEKVYTKIIFYLIFSHIYIEKRLFLLSSMPRFVSIFRKLTIGFMLET